MSLNCDEITCTLPQIIVSVRLLHVRFGNPHRGNLWVNHSWMDITVAGPGLGGTSVRGRDRIGIKAGHVSGI